MVYRIPGYASGGLPNFTWGGARHCGSVECSSGGHTRPRYRWEVRLGRRCALAYRVCRTWKCSSSPAACTSRALPGPGNTSPRRINARGGRLLCLCKGIGGSQRRPSSCTCPRQIACAVRVEMPCLCHGLPAASVPSQTKPDSAINSDALQTTGWTPGRGNGAVDGRSITRAYFGQTKRPIRSCWSSAQAFGPGVAATGAPRGAATPHPPQVSIGRARRPQTRAPPAGASNQRGPRSAWPQNSAILRG